MDAELERWPWLGGRASKQAQKECADALYHRWCEEFEFVRAIDKTSHRQSFIPHHSIGHFGENRLAMAAYLESKSVFELLPVPSALMSANVVNGLGGEHRRILGNLMARETAASIEIARSHLTGEEYLNDLGIDPGKTDLNISRSLLDGFRRMHCNETEILEMWQSQLHDIYTDIVQGTLKPQ